MSTGDGLGLEGRRTPIELGADEFREIGHQLIDDVADLLASMRERPLATGESPEQVRALLESDQSLPNEGTDAATLLRQATDLLVDHSIYNAHPRFFGYITAGAAPIGILGDLLASAINQNVGSWSLSPMATEIEAQTVRWISELVGFPTGGGGVLVSGGNVANMLGFWAARASRVGWDVREHGMRAKGARDLRVYGSKGMHTWIQKAADLSGIGAGSIRWVDTDQEGRIDIRALRAQIEADVAADAVPMMVVGTGGSVSTGVVDPLPELRELCDEYGAWFHVDGAYGAFAVAASAAPPELRGIALADSVAVDPHKWLYAPLEAGCTLVRDPDALLAAFSYRPEYYHFPDGVQNFFEHGIQNSRGFRALKVWLVLRHAGRDGYRRMIDQDIALASRFHAIAAGHPELEAFTHALSITTYRFVPADLSARAKEEPVSAYLDTLNETLLGRIEKSGRAFVSNAVLDGTFVLRMCIVNFRTSLEDVEALADITAELGRAVDQELRPEALR
ncbi:MAG: aminotransferase class V-fold PLP-dependent enzyme [Gemmatimonadota bacterium]|nr:aminotransferase class V-fold PLP-dependent enzyme [Gemmatimonadota bacterium]